MLKPKSVIDYNKSKQGIDLSDQFNSYYTPKRKGSKWWRKLAFEFLLGTAIANSWILFNKFFNSGKKISLLNFKESILTSYFELDKLNFNVAKPIRGSAKSTKSHYLKISSGQARKTRRRCANCYRLIQEKFDSKRAASKTTKVRTYCSACPGQPAMCVNCFEQLH